MTIFSLSIQFAIYFNILYSVKKSCKLIGQWERKMDKNKFIRYQFIEKLCGESTSGKWLMDKLGISCRLKVVSKSKVS